MKKSVLAVLMILLLSLCVTAYAADLAFVSKSYELFEGDQLDLQSELIRSNGAAADGELTFKISSPKQASIDNNGVLTGKAKGSATVTAVLKTDDKTYKATTTVKVYRPVTSIALNEKGLTVYTLPDDPAL